MFKLRINCSGHAGKQYTICTQINQNLRAYRCIYFAYTGFAINNRLAMQRSLIIGNACLCYLCATCTC